MLNKVIIIFILSVISLNVIIDAASCGGSGIPFRFEVTPSGSVILGCAIPQCFGGLSGGKGFLHDSKFNAISEGEDGFFRESDFNRIKSRLPVASPQTANCESSFTSQSCSNGNSWVGGFLQNKDGSLGLQCCTYEGMRFSQEVGKPIVHSGEVYSGGEVIRDGRQTGFDLITNIKKINGGYELTVYRMNCLPDPAEETNDVQLNSPNDITRILDKVTEFHRDSEPRARDSVEVVQTAANYASRPIVSDPVQGSDTFVQVGEASVPVQQGGYYYPVAGTVPACFAPNTTVITSNGPIEIRSLKIGDMVLSEESGVPKLSEVTSFLHKLPDTEVSYIHLELDDGSHLDITPQHFIYKGGCKEIGNDMVYAERVKVGDCVNKISEDGKFISMKVVDSTVKKIIGAYSPLTKNGNILVNNISASCYSVVKSNSLAHSFFHYINKLNQLISYAATRIASKTGVVPEEETVELPVVAKYLYDTLNLIIPETIFDGETRNMFMKN
uniref:Warthog protein 1 (inferred by orthology to a C. elegans protein) n=1 Tax=Strongyloides venezuelensis TaxID=75913 RepID=A0A0K0FAY6_STRVS